MKKLLGDYLQLSKRSWRTMPIPKLYVYAPYLTSVFDRSREFGLANQSSANDDHNDLLDPLSHGNTYIERGVASNILNEANRRSGDEFFCFKAGQLFQPMQLGSLGHLFLSCSNTLQAVSAHLNYGRLVTNAYRINYNIDAKECVGFWLPIPGEPPPSRSEIEFNMAVWGTLTRNLVGAQISPTRIELPFARPRDTHCYDRFFQCELLFNREKTAVYFSHDLLGMPLRRAHDQMQSVIASELDRQLTELRSTQSTNNSSIDRVRKLISIGIQSGNLSQQVVARKMNTSERGLQRHLQGFGLTFRELCDQERKKLVGTYMRNPSLSLVDVSLLAGFSDQSSFHRAFRRWFGCPPSVMRGALRER